MSDSKSISRDIKEFIKPFEKLANICSGDPKSSDLLKAIDKLPPAEAINGAILNQKNVCNQLANDLVESEKKKFREAWNGFVRNSFEAREKSLEKWQIGQFGLYLDHDKCSAYFTYIDEKLVTPEFIQSEDDLKKMHENALDKINKEEQMLSPDEVVKLMHHAYKNAINKNDEFRDKIPVKVLYHEFRLAVVEEELKKSPEKDLKDSIQIPLWLFKLRVNQYITQIKSSTGSRIDWVTGSQQESLKKMGILLGNPTHPEMKCWAQLR